jgi:uncharacterized protein (DUF2062 family)
VPLLFCSMRNIKKKKTLKHFLNYWYLCNLRIQDSSVSLGNALEDRGIIGLIPVMGRIFFSS